MKISFFGDTVLSNHVKINEKLNWIRENDYNFINLEAPFIIENQKIKKSINVYSEKNIDFLKKNKFNLINVANNHFFDFGEVNALKVIENLKENNFRVIGYGKNKTEALKPIILKNKFEKNIGIFTFSCEFIDTIIATDKRSGIAPLTEKDIYTTLDKYKNLDFKICYFHYGIEYEDYPEYYYRELFRKLIELELVDIIIGTHPHCIQGYECAGNGVIFYSLGNFLFPEKEYLGKKLKFPEKSKFGYFINLEIKEKISWSITEYIVLENGQLVSELNHNITKKLSNKFNLSQKNYLKFYRKNRIRKRFPIRLKNEKLNNVKWALYKKLEKKLYKLYLFLKK